MRISDWSSDVCSSDLLLGQIVIDDHGMHAVVAEELAHGAAGIGRQVLQRRRLRGGGGDDDGVFHRAGFLEGERMSVVLGKSVSVRVCIGGHRMIKKKTKEEPYTDKYH